MNHRKIFFWSVTVALAGFLFGFDTVVISGADLALQALWPRGAVFHGFVVMASALWGTVIGAMLGGIPADRMGRKETLFWIGVLYFVSAVGSALANDPWVFAFYQFNIVFGILAAFLSNYLLSGGGDNAWRWMLGVEAFPALAYLLMVRLVPESPRWLLVKKQDRQAAARTLRLLNPDADTEAELRAMLADQPAAGSTETIFHPKYRLPLTLAFLIAFFNQFSGINAFLYYAPRIFEIAGLGKSTALLSSVGIGVANLVFTLAGVALIDRFGRRQLLYIGSVGYIVSLSLVAAAFALGTKGMAVPIFLFLFIAAHAVGQGAVIWVFISEIFPTHLRASGQAFGSSVHWVLAAAIPSLIPVLFSQIGAAPVFAFFAFMMTLQLLFVWKMMPETKGVSLENLEKRLTGRD